MEVLILLLFILLSCFGRRTFLTVFFNVKTQLFCPNFQPDFSNRIGAATLWTNLIHAFSSTLQLMMLDYGFSEWRHY